MSMVDISAAAAIRWLAATRGSEALRGSQWSYPVIESAHVLGLGLFFGMIMMLNLGIGLCHPPVGATLFVGCAVGKVTIEQVMRRIWPFYGVMFAVLMAVTFIPEISLWLPRHVLR